MSDPSDAAVATRGATADLRLYVVKAFVIATAVLVPVSLFILWASRRDSAPAGAPPTSATHPAVTVAPARPEPRINDYWEDETYVVEAVTPGVQAEAHIGHDPVTLRVVFTISWSPPEL